MLAKLTSRKLILTLVCILGYICLMAAGTMDVSTGVHLVEVTVLGYLGAQGAVDAVTALKQP